MAGPPKRKVVEKSNEASSSSGDESESESYHGQEEIQADFEGRNPEGGDFHGIKQLLNQLFLKSHVNISALSDILINQPGIGSVLKQSSNDEDEDDDMDDLTDALDVFGITSVINMTKNKQTDCIKELIELLKDLSKQHADGAMHAQILNILSSNKKIGLLINERFVNIPAKIADPLLTSLLGEMDRMKQKDPTYNFDYLIMISKLHKEKKNPQEIFYSNAEEELFAKAANFSFEFNVQNDSDSTISGKWSESDVEMVPFRQVLIFEGNMLPNLIQQVKVLVN